jgi:hypothetical protein
MLIMMNTANAMQVAETIKAQLGGRALYMLGASQLVGDANSLMFAIKGCRTVNKIRVQLDASDTYTIQFWKIGRGALSCKLVHEVSDVYADSLHAIIERQTGLYTSL